MYESKNSVYCYKGTNVLVNKMNIKDPIALKNYETSVIGLKLMALSKRGITGKFDVSHFVSIHKFLFEDIYPFAGLFRTENIAKDYFQFAEWEYIESELTRLLSELKSENFLANLTKEKFTERLAYYWAELNVLHPFREGNGRATRIWLDLILKKELCMVIDWSKVDKEDYLLAMERSPIKDIEIKHILKNALTDKINDRELYMKGIDNSYHYEGYTAFKAGELWGL